MKDRLGQLGTLCALTPLADEGALRAELAAWATSPFARLPQTHFARFVVLPGLRRETVAQPVDRLSGPYLMFSAFFDGDPEAWLGALCEAMPAEAEAVWRHCRGFPGGPQQQRHAFVKWLLEHRVPATAVFGAYPDATVQDVRDALAFRERFREFAFDLERRRGAQAAFTSFARDEATP